MKKCNNCDQKYNDEYFYCLLCGNPLIPIQENDKEKYKNKIINKNIKIILLILVIFIAIGFVICSSISEQLKLKQDKEELNDYKMKKILEEYEKKPNISDLEINNDWTHYYSNGYIYIKGSVTNISSSKIISYYKVEALFYDENGDIVDSDYINDIDDIDPGETRQFNMMHKVNSYNLPDDIRLSISEVN